MTRIQTTSGKFIERKERRIYLADKCPVHGIRYQSFSKRKLKMGCRKCRSNHVNPNQLSFLGEATKLQEEFGRRLESTPLGKALSGR